MAIDIVADILRLIPQSLKQQAKDALVDFVADQAKKAASDALSDKIKKLRSDADFSKKFQEGLSQAVRCFVEEYEIQDEDLVAAIAADRDFFQNKEIRDALLEILQKPGAYLEEPRDKIVQSFASIFPERRNRERVDRAVTYLLRCLAEELWHLPELQPVYSLQFQRITAEATREQVELYKAQLRAQVELNTDIRDALLQLADVLTERKLLSPGDTPVADEPAVYHNLPTPEYGRFVGRGAELAQVVQILRPYPQSQHAVVTIDGIGGIGKSALALEVAHRYLQNYDRIPPAERFEAIIWTSAKQTVLTADGIKPRQQILRTLDDIYTTIAVTLQREDITRARAEEQAELVRNALTRQRTLLIVDNLETVDDEAVMAFLRELPAPTKAIVTTRHRVDVAYPVRLTGMSEQDGLTLITQECAKKGASLSDAEAAKLYERTGGVPLAMVWSVAQVGCGYRVETVLRRLGQPTEDVSRFCFEGVVESIKGKPSYRLLLALAFAATDASREALGYVADLPELDRDEGLVELERLSLANKSGERFLFLPLTKAYASEELTQDSGGLKAIGRRWVDYLKELSRGVEGEYYWRYMSYAFYADGRNILQAIQWSYNHGSADDVFQLVLAAYNYLEVAGRWNEIVEICREARDLAISVHDLAVIARIDDVIGWVLMQWGDYREAETTFRQSLDYYELVNNQEGKAITLERLSAVYRKMGDFDKALDMSRQALGIAEDLGAGDLIALVKTECGKLARDLGQLEIAWNRFTEVKDWFEQRTEQSPRDEPLARGTWGHLAIVALRLGHPQEAKALCLKSLEFFETYGTKGYLATLKYRLALAEEALGEYKAARQHIQEAMDWFERLGMKPDYVEAKVLLDKLQPDSPE